MYRLKQQRTRILTTLVSVGFLVFVIVFASNTLAAFNEQINYQGKLTDTTDAAVADGSYNIRYKLYTAPSGGSPVWTETWCYTPDGGSTCNGTGSDNRADVVSGLFSNMLGTSTSLSTVDFDQTLYLGVEIGGSGTTPTWDGEMTPRKILGAVPAAFEAKNLGGASSTQFLRSDEPDTMASSSASTLLTINQSGTGDILNLLDGGTEVFTVLDGGNVGIGTSSPSSLLHLSAVEVGGTPSANANLIIEDNGNNYINFMGGTSDTQGVLFGDTANSNTGEITYDHSNNSLQIQTNNTDQLTITSAGNVGIGTTSPSYSLEIEKPSNARLMLRNTNTDAGNSVSALGLSRGLNNNVAAVGVLDDESKLRFLVGSNVSPSYTNFQNFTRMTIDSSGNVGIGTTSPDTPVHVESSVDGLATFESTDAVANIALKDTSNTSLIELRAGSIRLRDSGTAAGDEPFKFTLSAPSNSLVIEATTGDVGFGIASPVADLHIYSATDDVSSRLETDKVNGSTQLDFLNDAQQWRILGDTSDTLHIQDVTNSIFALSIDNANGKVGIGDTTPVARFHVGSSTPGSIPSGNYYNSAYVSGDLEVDGTIYGDLDASNIALTQGYTLVGDGSNQAVATSTLFIDADEQVGIGASSPSSKLHIDGGTGSLSTGLVFGDGDTGFYESSDDNLEMATAGTRWFTLTSSGAITSQIVGGGRVLGTAGAAATPAFNFAGDNDTGIYRASANNMRLVTGGSDRLTIDSSGNVGIGDGSPEAHLEVSADGTTGGNIFLLSSNDGSDGDLLTVTEAGLVGIGTTSPYAKLSVTGTAGQTKPLFSVASSTNAQLFTVTSGGNVGIGVVNPDDALDVLGKIDVSGIVDAGAGLSAGFQSGGVNLIQRSSGDAVYGYSATITGHDFYTGGNFNTTIDNAGVGIGDGSPEAHLEVSADGTTGGNIFLLSSNDGSDGDLLTVTEAGLVGIGTTSPYAKLSVTGTAGQTKPLFSVASSSDDTLLSVSNFGNLSVTAELSLVSETSLGGTSEQSEEIVVQGRYAYVADDGDNVLRAYDVTNVSSPGLVGSIAAGATPEGLDVAGAYAYVVDNGSDLLRIFDISNPKAMVQVGSATIANGAADISVSGSYAYVVNGSATYALQIFNVANPSQPVLAGSVNLENIGLAVDVHGGYAYVAHYDSGGFNDEISIYDVSDPTSPIRTDSTALGEFFVGKEIVVSGRYLYFVNDDDSGGITLEIYDVSDASNITYVGSSVDLGSNVPDFSISGKYAYVIDTGSDDVIQLDISNPSSPSIVSTLGRGTIGNLDSMFLSGRYLYIVDDTADQLDIVDVGGIESTSGLVHALEVGTFQAREDVFLNKDLSVLGGLNVGKGGIFSAGPIVASVASSTQAGAISALFDGFVGIGTSTPTTLLTVGSSTSDSIPVGNYYNSAFVSGDLEVDGTIYGATASSSDRNVATIIVSAVDSLNKDKADFVADGTDDDVTIEAAIAALPSTGGVIYLLDGTFTLGADIDITDDNVTLRGAGPSTVIALADGVDVTVLIIDAVNADQLVLADFSIDANDDGNTGVQDAVSISSSASSTVANLSIDDTNRYGIHIFNGSHGNLVANNTLTDTGTNGIYIEDSNNERVIGNEVRGSGTRGIYLDNSDYSIVSGNDTSDGLNSGMQLTNSEFNTISSNIVSNNTDIGIYVVPASNNTLSGNIVDGNDEGIRLQGAAYGNTITANKISNSGDIGIWLNAGTASTTVTSNSVSDGATAGIQVSGAGSDWNLITSNTLHNNGGASTDSIIVTTGDNNTISNNVITDTAGSGYAIDIDAGAENTYVYNNSYSGTGATQIRDLGTGTRYVQSNRLNIVADSASDFQDGAYTGLTVTQSGAGDILNLLDGGTEVFTVLDGGNVGIGTSSPSELLHIYSSSENPTVFIQGSNTGDRDSYLSFGDTDYATNGVDLWFDRNQIAFNFDSKVNADVKAFNFRGKTAGTPVDILTLLSGGNLGIGTTSPYAKLSVVGETVSEYFTATSTTATSTLPNLSSTAFNIGGDYITDITGTNLSVTNGVLSAAGGGGGTPGGSDGQVQYNNGGAFGGATGLVYDDGTDFIGIGTTTPTNKLHIATTDGSANLTIEDYADVGNTIMLSLRRTNDAPILNFDSQFGAWNVTGGNKFTIADADTGVIPFTIENSPTVDTLYLTSAGNVGIGTSTPDQMLTVAGTIKSQPAGRGEYQAVINNGSINDNFVLGEYTMGGIDPDQTLYESAIIRARAAEAWGASAAGTDLEFYTTPIGSVTPVQSLTILSSGNVGIGTSSPSQKLHVSGAGVLGQTINSTDGNITFLNLLSGSNSWNVELGRESADTFGIFQGGGGGSRLVIDTSGNVGIGTSSPDQKLTIQEDDGSAAQVHLYSNVNNQFKGYRYGGTEASKSATPANSPLVFLTGAGHNGTSEQTGGHLSIRSSELWSGSAEGTYMPIYLTPSGGTSPSELFRFTGEGELGIGTSTPLAPLHVNVDSVDDNPEIYLSSWGGTTPTTWRFFVNRNTGRFNIGDTTNSVIPFKIDPGASDNSLFIGSSGNVGIGTTSPFARLSVVGGVVSEYINATSTTATSTLAGSLDVGEGAIFYDYSGNETSIENLNLGAIAFDTDAGTVSWIDLPISSAAATGTSESYTAQIDNNKIFTIYGQADGSGGLQRPRVVVGTTTNATVIASTTIPDYSLIIENGILCVDDGGADDCDNSSRTRGGVYAETGSLGGLDVAETYPTIDTDLEAGDIVMLDPENPLYVTKLDSDTEKPIVLGVVSTKPGLLLGGFKQSVLLENQTQVPVALAGRVPVKIALDGGVIEHGDRLTFSTSTPGFAAKASPGDISIGIALEPYDGTESGVFSADVASSTESDTSVETPEVNPGADTILVFVEHGRWGDLSSIPLDLFGTASSTSDEGSAFSLNGIVNVVLAGLENLGVRITAAAANFSNLFADNFTVGTSEKPTGITLYDEVTGEPYCLSIRNGESVSRSGVCEIVSDSGGDDGDDGTSTTTDSGGDDGTATSTDDGGTATSTDDGSGGDTATSTDDGGVEVPEEESPVEEAPTEVELPEGKTSPGDPAVVESTPDEADEGGGEVVSDSPPEEPSA